MCAAPKIAACVALAHMHLLKSEDVGDQPPAHATAVLGVAAEMLPQEPLLVEQPQTMAGSMGASASIPQ